MAICRMKELEQEQPAVEMTAEDGADLRRCRRGIEPLRIDYAAERSAGDHLARYRAAAGSCEVLSSR
jgi:hypothetical protein